MEISNLNELNKLNEDEIYLRIGNEVFKEEQNLKALSPKQTIEKAKVWFKLNLPKFQNAICHNTSIKASYDNSDVGNLSTALIDLIAGALTGIAPATAAYLIYRKGLNIICKNYWDVQ